MKVDYGEWAKMGAVFGAIVGGVILAISLVGVTIISAFVGTELLGFALTIIGVAGIFTIVYGAVVSVLIMVIGRFIINMLDIQVTHGWKRISASAFCGGGIYQIILQTYLYLTDSMILTFNIPLALTFLVIGALIDGLLITWIWKKMRWRIPQ